MEALFGVSKSPKPKPVERDSAMSPKVLMLIDPKRSQNVSIALAQFKSFGSYDAIATVGSLMVECQLLIYS